MGSALFIRSVPRVQLLVVTATTRSFLRLIGGPVPGEYRRGSGSVNKRSKTADSRYLLCRSTRAFSTLTTPTLGLSLIAATKAFWKAQSAGSYPTDSLGVVPAANWTTVSFPACDFVPVTEMSGLAPCQWLRSRTVKAAATAPVRSASDENAIASRNFLIASGDDSTCGSGPT